MKLSDGYLIQEIGNEYVMIPVGQNIADYKKVYRLNASGYFLVQKLDKSIDYADLFMCFVKEFGNGDEKGDESLKRDMDAFLRELATVGALR